jgi:hypothetical protein
MERKARRGAPGAGLVELARALDLEHEVPAVDVLHDEEEAVARLEGGVQRREEGVPRRQRQHAPLRQRALHVVVLDDRVLLQHLHRVHLHRDTISLLLTHLFTHHFDASTFIFFFLLRHEQNYILCFRSVK